MALVTETIRVVNSGPANPGTTFYTVQVNTATGAGVNPVSIPIMGTNSGSDTVHAYLDSHSLTSNAADIVWQATNGQIAVTPYTVTAYSGPTNLRGWPGAFGSVLGTTAGVNSLVFNEVVPNYPINPFCEPNNVSSCGGGYKKNPMVAVQQTAGGGGATPLDLAGTSTNNSSGNFPGFILSGVTTLVVGTSGTYTFYVNYANVSAFAVYIGNGATFSSASAYGGNGSNPFPSTGPKSGVPLAIVSTNNSAASHPAVVSTYVTFPTPGIYTIEFVYNQYLSCQFSYDNNSYFQITYIAGAQNQNAGNQGPGIGFQSFPVTAAVAPPTGAAPSGDLRLTPTGGAAGLKVQGQTDTLTLTVQNVPYTSIPYCPIFEGTAGSLFVYNNSGNTFTLQTYNGNAVDTTAAANNAFAVTGSNTSGIFSVAPSGSAFALKYNGGAFSFIIPGSQISTTDLTLTADDISWYFNTDQSFDLFTPVSGSGGIAYSIAVDFMTKPTVKSVSPASLNATGVAQAITINLNKPMSPQQQGLYGTGNTVAATASVTFGAFISTLTAIKDSAGYLQGWSATVTPALSSTNGSITLNMVVSGTLTYLSGTSFVTNTVTYINGAVATIPTIGDQYVVPVAVSLTMAPAANPLGAVSQTLTGTVYTFDNSALTMNFYSKGTASGSTAVLLGAGTLSSSFTSVVGGKTAYNKVFKLTHTFPTVTGTSLADGQIYIGFTASDTVSGLSTTYYSTTVYQESVTIVSGGGSCFTAPVAIETPNGLMEFGDLPEGTPFEIVNETGTHLAELVVHENYFGWMVQIGEGERFVTEDHAMKSGTEWLRADEKYAALPRFWFEGTVYNLHVLSDKEEDKHYILFNGDVAHNLKIGGSCFTGNVEFETPTGYLRFDEAPEGWFDIKNETGIHKARLVVHKNWHEEMIDMGGGELVTFGHHIKATRHDEFAPAIKALDEYPTVDFTGTVYNLEVDTEDDASHHYVLKNGIIAHNVIKA